MASGNAGDLYEWNLDWYATYVDPWTDCAKMTTGSNRVSRGGDFTNAVVVRVRLGPIQWLRAGGSRLYRRVPLCQDTLNR